MKVGFIGCGNMGGALARAVARSGAEIMLCDINTELRDALAAELNATAVSMAEAASKAELLFLGVKPNAVAAVAESLRNEMNDGAAVVCMAAGVPISTLSGILGEKRQIIRIMPNLPVGIGEGMTVAAASSNTTQNTWSVFEEAMAHSGRVERMDERLIDGASALSGSGPAFVYMFIEALADGAVAAGLGRDAALSLATQTLIGAAKTVQQTEKHPERLKDDVCSPGGSTIDGVRLLDRAGFRGIVAEAVLATFDKVRTLGKK